MTPPTKNKTPPPDSMREGEKEGGGIAADTERRRFGGSASQLQKSTDPMSIPVAPCPSRDTIGI
jgi:hypothetical protein